MGRGSPGAHQRPRPRRARPCLLAAARPAARAWLVGGAPRCAAAWPRPAAERTRRLAAPSSRARTLQLAGDGARPRPLHAASDARSAPADAARLRSGAPGMGRGAVRPVCAAAHAAARGRLFACWRSGARLWHVAGALCRPTVQAAAERQRRRRRHGRGRGAALCARRREAYGGAARARAVPLDSRRRGDGVAPLGRDRGRPIAGPPHRRARGGEAPAFGQRARSRRVARRGQASLTAHQCAGKSRGPPRPPRPQPGVPLVGGWVAAGGGGARGGTRRLRPHPANLDAPPAVDGVADVAAHVCRAACPPHGGTSPCGGALDARPARARLADVGRPAHGELAPACARPPGAGPFDPLPGRKGPHRMARADILPGGGVAPPISCLRASPSGHAGAVGRHRDARTDRRHRPK